MTIADSCCSQIKKRGIDFVHGKGYMPLYLDLTVQLHQGGLLESENETVWPIGSDRGVSSSVSSSVRASG